MKEIIEKISSYNIFNYLFPGVVFAILATKFTDLNLTFDNLFLGAFAYYFIGLVISRFGSVFIEPFLKLTRIVKFEDYIDFVAVSKSDNKLEILSEANNMYRTLVSMFLLLFLIFGFNILADKWEFLKNNQDIILLTFLFFLFLLSYRKQTNYITKRIKASK